MQILEGLSAKALLFAINDGSLDNTLAVLRSLAEKHPGKILVDEKSNLGRGRSFRYSYERACQTGGEWNFQDRF